MWKRSVFHSHLRFPTGKHIVWPRIWRYPSHSINMSVEDPNVPHALFLKDHKWTHLTILPSLIKVFCFQSKTAKNHQTNQQAGSKLIEKIWENNEIILWMASARIIPSMVCSWTSFFFSNATSPFYLVNNTSLPKTNIAPENGWLEG